eukprot:6855408-Pyramimonas_sp.AAC.1
MEVGLDLVVDLAWPILCGWMPLLLVTKTERLPAISCGFAPFLSVPTRSCPSSTTLASGPRQPLAMAPWPWRRVNAWQKRSPSKNPGGCRPRRSSRHRRCSPAGA